MNTAKFRGQVRYIVAVLDGISAAAGDGDLLEAGAKGSRNVALPDLRNPFGNWVVWIVSLDMILGEPVYVLVFPFAEGGRCHYIPGMFTALFPLVLGLWGISELLKDYRAAKSNSGANA